MIETCRLKNVVIFIQTILSFMQSKKIITYVSCSIQLNETEINKVILPKNFKMKTVSFFFSV